MHYVKYETLRFEYLREQARRSLFEFFKQAWHVLEPQTELIESWHMQVICDHLDAVRRGEIRKLIINLPPGFCKSLIVACAFNAHVWIESPGERFLSASYSRDLSIRDTRRTRNIVRSAWYQNNWGTKSDWPNSFKILGDQNVKSSFENDHRGWRIGTSVGGSTTGQRGSYLLADDPVKIDDSTNDVMLTKAVMWFRDVWGSRKTDPRMARDVVIQQRLNERDPSGYLMREIGDYELLILPMRKPKKDYPPTSLGVYDKRKPGELLDPIRYPEHVVKADEKRLGSFGASSQLQQDPRNGSEELFNFSDFVFWSEYAKDSGVIDLETPDGKVVTCRTAVLPDKFDSVIHSWDCSFGAKLETSSRVSGLVFGVIGTVFYLLDRVNKRMSFTETINAIKYMAQKHNYTGPRRILIEAKANGPAAIDALKSSIAGIIPITPKGPKISRAHACVPVVEGGGVVVQLPDEQSFVDEFLDELCMFPFGEHDDDVDAFSQAITYQLHGSPIITIT